MRRSATAWPVLGVYAAALLFVVVALFLAQRSGELHGLLQDIYNTTGSRLTGLYSIVDFCCWAAAAAVAVVSASLLSRRLQPFATDRRVLAIAAGVTLVLLVDDVIAIHELLGQAIGDRLGDTGLDEIAESIPILVEGLLIVGFVAYARSSVRRLGTGRWLALALVLLAGSVIVDLIPSSLVIRVVPIHGDWIDGGLVAAEETFKLLGIVTWLMFIIATARRSLLDAARAGALADG